jgi:hypothetical protein
MHEETLETALALLRFHLVNNVLAFHDINLQRQHRPTLAEGWNFCSLAVHRQPKPGTKVDTAMNTERRLSACAFLQALWTMPRKRNCGESRRSLRCMASGEPTAHLYRLAASLACAARHSQMPAQSILQSDCIERAGPPQGLCGWSVAGWNPHWASQLIPLLRAAGSALGVASLPVLQVKAAGEEMREPLRRPCPA